MSTRTLVGTVAVACIAGAALAAAALPSGAHAADPALTQGAPSYSRNVTASIGSRFIRIGVVMDSISSSIDPNQSSTIFSNSYQTYNALTCSGGWGQGGDFQPVAGTTINNGNNYADCPWFFGSTIAWGVQLVDLLP